MQILFNNTTIIPFKWRGRYICFYCGQNYNEYQSFRKHTKSHGLCSTSDYALKLIKGSYIEVKIDVSEIACDICYEPLTCFDEVVDHLTNKHELEYDKSIDIPIQEYQLSDCRCRICGQEFTYFGYLIQHTNIAHPQNTFICDNCGEKFNKKRDLAIHMRRYHQEGGYPCDECSDFFESYILLSKHKNNFHFRRCKICDLRFPSYTLLRRHIKCDHSDDNCPYCSKKCQTSQGLKQHITKCSKRCDIKVKQAFDEETIQPNKKKNVNQIRKNILCVLNMSTAVPFKFFTKYSCFYCSKSYVEFDDLKQHVVEEHPTCDLKEKCMKNCKGERISVKIDISSLSCRVCFESIDNVDSLIDHLITKHGAEYDKATTGCFESFKIIKDSIPCPICSSIFRYFGSLLRHINSEHSNNNRICDFCGRSFKNVANLKVHITYAHTGSCECDVCGVKYKNQWCLGRHKAKSHNAKDFQCTKCSERFQSQYHKQKHLIKVHDIGHKCSYCGKMFTRNSFMKDHIRRTHLKEKNVPCTVCNEKFFDNYLLRLHMVKHKGERKFSCEICGKAFLRRSNLSAHTEMHKKYGHV